MKNRAGHRACKNKRLYAKTTKTEASSILRQDSTSSVATVARNSLAQQDIGTSRQLVCVGGRHRAYAGRFRQL